MHWAVLAVSVTESNEKAFSLWVVPAVTLVAAFIGGLSAVVVAHLTHRQRRAEELLRWRRDNLHKAGSEMLAAGEILHRELSSVRQAASWFESGHMNVARYYERNQLLVKLDEEFGAAGNRVALLCDRDSSLHAQVIDAEACAVLARRMLAPEFDDDHGITTGVVVGDAGPHVAGLRDSLNALFPLIQGELGKARRGRRV